MAHWQSADSSSSRSHFYIHVLQATLNTPLDSNRKLHVTVTVPSAQVLRTNSVASKSGDVRLDWNKRYEFTTIASHEIKLELVIERMRGRKVCGEARIVIEDLLQRCEGSQDYTLELRKGASGEVRGHITVRLERKSSEGLTHQLIGEELSQLQQDDRLKELLRDREITGEDAVETIGLLLARMKPLLRVLDVVSIIPAFENAVGSVSSLYEMYQKRMFIDAEIMELLRIMRNALRLIQDTSSLKNVLSHFEDTVGKLLNTIHESSLFIRDYLDSAAIGQIWRTESNLKKLKQCKMRLESLRSDLQSEVIGTMSRTYKSTESHGLHVVIPPPPSEMFTGRDDYLDQMVRSFDLTKTSMELKKQRRFVLYGIGGTGKTQLALKFVEQNDDRFTTRYMIDASSAESIALSFEAIGTSLGIENPEISEVLTRLSQLKEDWLLLYDNADNPKLRLAPFFPKGFHGNIIVTTRNADLSSLAPNDNIEVLMLDEDAAVHLLLQSSRLESTEENRRLAQMLVDKFGRLALAIVQAGSYIASRRFDLLKYSRIYEKSQSTLLRIEPGQDVDYRAAVLTTWEISFAELSRHAQMLLNLCAFLYRDGITEDVFRLAVTSDYTLEPVEEREVDGLNVTSQERQRLKISDIDLLPSPSFLDLINWLRNKGGEWDDLRFAELMHSLCSFSLVQRPFPDVYSIHPLVYEWTRDRLVLSDRDAVQQDAWLLLCLSVRPSGDGESISISRMLLPHVSSCGRPTHVTIMAVFVVVYQACGQWKDSEALQASVVEWRIREDGNEHADTLSSIATLASIYWQQGRWNEAEKLEVEVLETSKRTLGSHHTDTLTRMGNLAMTYWNQGRWTEAEKLQSEVMETSKRMLGSEHPDTLTSMSNLASTYWKQGHWAQAEELEVEVLETTKRMLGSHHPDTIRSMGNLAMTYWNQNRWTEAEKLQVEVVETRKRILGPDHPDTLKSMGNLALTYWRQDRWAEAEKLEVEVLEASKRMLGSHHPDTLRNMGNLAMTYWNQSRWNEAEKLQAEVLETRKQMLGSDHPDTLTSMGNLALTYWNQGHFNLAFTLLYPAVESSKHVLGPSHPDTLTRSNNLVILYRELGRLDEADALEASLPSANSSRTTSSDSGAE